MPSCTVPARHRPAGPPPPGGPARGAPDRCREAAAPVRRQGLPPRAPGVSHRAGRTPARPPCDVVRAVSIARSTRLSRCRAPSSGTGSSASQACRLARTMAANAAIGHINGFRSDSAHRCTRNGCSRRIASAIVSFEQPAWPAQPLLVKPRIHLRQRRTTSNGRSPSRSPHSATMSSMLRCSNRVT